MSAPLELDALLDGLDESLQPIDGEHAQADDKTDDVADDIEQADDTQVDDTKADDAANQTADDTASDEETAEDEGYTIDELDAEEDAGKKDDPKTDTQVETPKADTSGFTPEQRYIYDNLSTVRIADKDGKTYDVKTFAELPADFEFANKKDELAFVNAMQVQELNARDLQGKFQSAQAEKSAQEWKQKENLADQYDINELQESGDLPKFKMKPSDPGFKDSAEAKLIKDILAYKEELNQQNFEKSQKTGTSMRLIGFKEAFIQYKYYGKDKAATTKSPELEAEDKARKNLAKRTTRTTSTDAKETTPRPVLRSSRDLMGYIDSLDI